MGDSEGEALENLVKLYRSHTGTGAAPDISIEKAVDTFIEDPTLQGVSPHRGKVLRSTVMRLMKYCHSQGIQYIREVTVPIARQYMLQRSRSKAKKKYQSRVDHHTPKISPKTLNQEIQVQKRFFRFCQLMEWIDRNPFEPIPYVKLPPREERFYFKEEHLKKIFGNAEGFYDFYTVLLYTGLRASDVFKLSTHHINDGKITLRMSKTGFWLRGIPLLPQLKPIVNQRLLNADPDTGLLFPELQSDRQRRYARKQLQSHFTREEVRNLHINLHTFRHTFAHMMLDSGVPKEILQVLLGHQSVNTTEIYANWIASDEIGKRIRGLVLPISNSYLTICYPNQT